MAGIVLGGIDVTAYLAIIAVAVIAYIVWDRYNRGIPLPIIGDKFTGRNSDDPDEIPDSKEIILEPIPIDMKLYNKDTEETFNYTGFEIDYESDDVLEGNIHVSKNGRAKEDIHADVFSQCFVKVNKSFLEGVEATIVFSKKGVKGIYSGEIDDL